MNTEKIPLSKVIRDLHEKLQTELKMYKYQGKANSIVHQVAENADAVDKVLSKPKKKKKLDEVLLKGRSDPKGNTINIIDDGRSNNDIMTSMEFVSEIVSLVKNGVISFSGIKKPNLVQSDLESQIQNIEDRLGKELKISRSKVSKVSDELLVVNNNQLELNTKIFTTEGILVDDDEQEPQEKSQPKSRVAPSLFDVRHGQATATAPIQSTLTPKGKV